MSTKTLVLAILTIASFCTLSFLSNYQIRAVQSLNWDIVLMLTPYGLIDNLIVDPTSYLKPYYFQRLTRPPGSTLKPLVFSALVHIPLALSLLYILKRRRKL